ncbi:ABC transporter G family member 23-like [Rhipicephalus sanguineus]|uniref:ABC transporter G family member 23-like n=1 Tax=Rhipicephalus sanguineus TaxID=34632 RepID=UPI0020C2B048|nr:ABC transporter G family member 23-like [Rhipicephalus sanguineus]
MSYLAKASSLKRQPNTLLTYFPKKSPCADSRDAATTPQCQIPVVEEPLTDQISSSDESIGQQVLTDDASFDEPAHPNDLGIYAGKSSLLLAGKRPCVAHSDVIRVEGTTQLRDSPRPAALLDIPAAVTVRDLNLQYSKRAPPVIDGANLTVPKGVIYGLLGASGCGKTSFLKCLVGLIKPDSGTVLVFGKKLHQGLVPGPAVGYMPQELALLEDFTIAENMYFFGQLLGMPWELIYSRINFLSSFFQLLPANRFVQNLSGGQQRRVSLAVALMHTPPFLILDEPTVGLDPVLRDAIWRYFVVLSREQATTIVVTTHFIEEIADAALVGIMRNAKIWCETPPSQLINLYGPGTLSDAYLKVCRRLDFPDEKDPSPPPQHVQARDVKLASVPDSLLTWKNWASVRSVTRVRALVAKNLLKIMRRLVTIVFQLVMPSCVGVVFCLFVGANPTDLPMAVVNEDKDGVYPKAFLSFLDPDIIRQTVYPNRDEAFAAVLKEDVWGTIYFPENYSRVLRGRMEQLFLVSDKIARRSTIDVFLDATDYTIRNVIIKELRRANDKVLQFATSKLINKNITIELLKISDPFYDACDFTFREFMSPGIIACTLFALSITLTALLLVGEDQGGIRGRCAVAGFFTSSVSKDEATALLLSMAALYPALLMGGVLWPVEGTPTVLRPISYAVPQALPVHGLRGAMLRNYTMANRQVQNAVAANVVWTLALLLLAIITFSYTAK